MHRTLLRETNEKNRFTAAAPKFREDRWRLSVTLQKRMAVKREKFDCCRYSVCVISWGDRGEWVGECDDIAFSYLKTVIRVLW